MTLHDAIISTMPAGLDRAILRILSFHKGKDSVISRDDLVKACAAQGYKFKDDRPIRACINDLRKRGNLICSAGGNGGGYFSPASPQEFDEYLMRELHPRAMDLLEQEKAMRAAAEKLWGAASRQMGF